MDCTCASYCRKHDVRVILKHYEVVKPDHQLYHIVNDLVRTLSLSNPNDCTIGLVPRTKNWNVNFIRHKKKHTYALGDKYMVTVSSIREYAISLLKTRNDEPLDVTPDLYKKRHTEVEVGVVYFLLYIFLNILSFPILFSSSTPFSLVPQHSLGVCLWT